MSDFEKISPWFDIMYILLNIVMRVGDIFITFNLAII